MTITHHQTSSRTELCDHYDPNEPVHITCCRGDARQSLSFCGVRCDGKIMQGPINQNEDCKKCLRIYNTNPDYCPAFGRCF